MHLTNPGNSRCRNVFSSLIKNRVAFPVPHASLAHWWYPFPVPDSLFPFWQSVCSFLSALGVGEDELLTEPLSGLSAASTFVPLTLAPERRDYGFSLTHLKGSTAPRQTLPSYRRHCSHIQVEPNLLFLYLGSTQLDVSGVETR